MSIQSKLDVWRKSAKGQAKIQAAVGRAARGGTVFGRSVGTVEASMLYAEKMRDILVNWIPEKLHIRAEDIVISDPAPRPDGSVQIELSFTRGAVHRESLYPEKYPQGAYHIVNLLTNGYGGNPPKNHVYGYWGTAGKVVRSVKTRTPEGFMQAAVSEFNRKYGGSARAELE